MLAVEETTQNLTLMSLMKHLVACYNTFGLVPYNPKLAASSAKSFCLLCADLSKRVADDRFWRIKPNFDLLTELGEMQTQHIGDPSTFWCYADEDFVG